MFEYVVTTTREEDLSRDKKRRRGFVSNRYCVHRRRERTKRIREYARTNYRRRIQKRTKQYSRTFVVFNIYIVFFSVVYESIYHKYHVEHDGSSPNRISE